MPVTHFQLRFFLLPAPLPTPHLFASSSSKHMRDVNQSPCPQLTTASSPARAMLPGVSVPRFRPERRVRISIKSIGSYPPADDRWLSDNSEALEDNFLRHLQIKKPDLAPFALTAVLSGPSASSERFFDVISCFEMA